MSGLSLLRMMVLLALPAGAARADGVAVLKEQPFHRDLTAKAVMYRKIADSRGPWLRIVTPRGNLDVGRSKLVAWMDLPDGPPRSVEREHDVSHLRDALGEMKRFARLYPATRPLLAPEIAVAEAHLARFDAGEIRFEGVWMSPVERDRMLEERMNRAEAELHRQALELQSRREMEADGLVAIGGEWVGQAEAAKRSPVESTELSAALWPLARPDLEGAKRCIERLNALAANQGGATKVRTLRARDTLRNLFAAENRYGRQKGDSAAIEARAARYERQTTEWLKPNAFGTVREDEARVAAARALDLRNQAAARLEACGCDVREQLRETDLLAEDFYRMGEHRAALALGETVRAVAGRNFPAGSYEPVLADVALEEIRGAIAERRKR